MKEVLSQQEIDSLLDALNTGEINPDTIKEEEEKNKIRSYDFRRPIKLSKEYMNTIYMVIENFSKMAGNTISNSIHANVEIKIGAIEQVSYDEFIRSIPNPTLLGIFRSKPLIGTQIMEVNPQLCLQMIELMLGGSEEKSLVAMKKRGTFTDIELGVLEEILVDILKAFENAWDEIIEVKTELDSLETNPQLVQSISPNEPIVLITLVVELYNNKSFMNICIPYMSFENITDKLSIKNWFDFDKESDDINREVISEKLKSSYVNLKVSLGESMITVDDFLQLELGDIVQLDKRINSPLKLYIEDKPHYLVKPGEIDNKLAVEVLQYIEGEAD